LGEKKDEITTGEQGNWEGGDRLREGEKKKGSIRTEENQKREEQPITKVPFQSTPHCGTCVYH
jgi:hypothetical protein